MRFSARTLLVYLFPRVNTFMLLKATQMNETLFAHLAFVVLDADVDFHVIDIVTRRVERF